MNLQNSQILRRKVAREAASLLYSGIEKEYKQAKLKAARTLGVKFVPTNLEVAVELDRIAEEREGAERQERLIRMRKEALQLMSVLRAYNPILIGSVWRGTIHHGSDIDIVTYHEENASILKKLKQNNLKILRTELVSETKHGITKESFHIHLELPSKDEAEIIVRKPDEINRKEKCEIYGDVITGLNLRQLEKLLKENPTRKFVPHSFELFSRTLK